MTSAPALKRMAVLAEATSTPALGFVLIPVLAATTGSIGLGHFVFVQAICATVGVIGIGLSQSAINSVARHVAPQGRPPAGDARAALDVAGVASALIILVAMTPFSEFVSRATALPPEVVRLGLIWAALQLPGPVMLALLKGRERFVEAAVVELVAKAAVYGAFVFLLARGGPEPLVGALRAVIVAEALALAWRWAAATRLVGTGVPARPRDTHDYAAIFGFSGGVWLQSVSSLAFNTLDKFVIGVIGGPAVLGAYAATAQIASLVHFVPSVVASVHVPRIAAAQASPARLASARETLSREMRVLVVLLGACALAMIVAGHYSTLWPSLDIPGQAGAVAALLVAYTVLALVIVDYTMLLGTARTRAIGTAGLLGSVFACGLLVAGAVSESLLVVATGRLGYALVWAAGLRRQSRHTGPGHAPA